MRNQTVAQQMVDLRTEAATVTGIAGAGVMAVAAIWALVTLRGVSANLDLAEEHERQLH